MFLRRLYSSVPCPRNTSAIPTHSSSHISSARPQTRGRLRPTRLSPVSGRISKSIATKKVVASKAIVSRSHEGRGRRRPSTSSGSSSSRLVSADPFDLELVSDELSHQPSSATRLSPNGIPSAPRLLFTHPTPALNHVNEFRPIQLYPEQFKLHTTFTHPAHPLPLNLGTHIYTTPRKPSTTPITEDLFSPPGPPNPARRLAKPSRASANGLSDHFKVVSTLSHPALTQHLGGHQPSLYFGSGSSEAAQDLEFGGITGTLGYKAAELKEQNEKDWQAILNQFEAKQTSSSATTAVAEKVNADADIDEVVGSLNAMLSNLGMSSARGRRSNVVRSMEQLDLGMGEERVEMDSTKRKRKKKISKHKYKKRRKETRALRKRLGK
ncbi:hypothetical protein CI109_100123 [Kwoniella shandongensis]|uniref:Uncharacterized protein n=1 Tax=Kwoniella shandongensis TaxID=1734106 RepID=A0A5M6BPK4_9TREE|nr:uncharacterized protein CI109_006849 [Kwoniella shandongensis]KAA5524826.1 hypothetical protein CI109_006849 [Kwoniella shandongensis]